MTSRLPPAWADRACQLANQEHGLAVVITQRADGNPRASVVNSAVIPHPISGEPVLAFVSRGSARKLDDLRACRSVTVVFRAGWDWLAVEGVAQLVGPNDPLEGFGPDALAALLRTIYAAAVGGTTDQWSELDSTMVAERHTAVLIHPSRAYGEDSRS